MLPYLTTGLCKVIAFIHGKILFTLRCWYWSKRDDIIQCFRDQNHVVDICAAHGQSQRNTVGVAKEASFGSFFSPDLSGLGRYLLLRVEPLPWNHPRRATTNQCQWSRRTHPAWIAIVHGILRHLPNAGTSHERYCREWSHVRTMTSTGRQFAKQRISRPSPRVDRLEACDTQEDEEEEVGAREQYAPKARHRSSNHRPLF